MARYAAAIDQGTTSTRFMIFDHSGKVIALDQKEHEQIYPQPGWVEHSPLEIWERTQAVIAGALKQSGVEAKDLAAVGVTNQRETTVVWDKATGQPVYNAIVWQDTRTADICNELAKDGGQDRFRTKASLPLATYFSGPKIKWILDNVPNARARGERGDLLFGNIDTWIIWNLTALKVDGGMVRNELLMQFQADLLGVPVIRPAVAETTSLGAAYAAGLAVGFWEKAEDLRANWGKDKEWKPQMDAAQRERLYAGWKKAVTRTFDWVE